MLFVGLQSVTMPTCCRYVCVVQKAYQERDTVISTVTTKVKGFAFTNTSDVESRFWDVADYIIPPQVFVMCWTLPNASVQNYWNKNLGPLSNREIIHSLC